MNLFRYFVEEKFGSKFVESRSPPFHKSFEETSSITPIFFILSPGVDPPGLKVRNLFNNYKHSLCITDLLIFFIYITSHRLISY